MQRLNYSTKCRISDFEIRAEDVSPKLRRIIDYRMMNFNFVQKQGEYYWLESKLHVFWYIHNNCWKMVEVQSISNTYGYDQRLEVSESHDVLLNARGR